jgi:1,4-alpha-glucan branching enzyme
METKVCNGCNLEKSVNEYHKKKNGKYGRFAVCKECCKNISHMKWLKNENGIQEKRKEYVKNHKEQKLNTQRKYRENNKEQINKKNKIYYENNKERESERVMEYYYKNKDYVLQNVLLLINYCCCVQEVYH